MTACASCSTAAISATSLQFHSSTQAARMSDQRRRHRRKPPQPPRPPPPPQPPPPHRQMTPGWKRPPRRLCPKLINTERACTAEHSLRSRAAPGGRANAQASATTKEASPFKSVLHGRPGRDDDSHRCRNVCFSPCPTSRNSVQAAGHRRLLAACHYALSCCRQRAISTACSRTMLVPLPASWQKLAALHVRPQLPRDRPCRSIAA